MIKNPSFVVALVTVYLLAYYTLFNMGVNSDIIVLMFLLSPFLVAWMVIVILKYSHYKGPELEEGQEWGYQEY